MPLTPPVPSGPPMQRAHFATPAAHAASLAANVSRNYGEHGRSDNVRTKLAHQSYVVPADAVSALGNGSSTAGHAALNSMKQQAHSALADNGGGGSQDAMISPDEHVMSPADVSAMGHGDPASGKAFLDQLVAHARAQHQSGAPQGAPKPQGGPPSPPQAGQPPRPPMPPQGIPPSLARYGAPAMRRGPVPSPAPGPRPPVSPFAAPAR